MNPEGTTCSRKHNEDMRKYGLDKHSASAYVITLKGIKRCQVIQRAIV